MRLRDRDRDRRDILALLFRNIEPADGTDRCRGDFAQFD